MLTVCYWCRSVVRTALCPPVFCWTAISCFGAETMWWDAIGPKKRCYWSTSVSVVGERLLARKCAVDCYWLPRVQKPSDEMLLVHKCSGELLLARNCAVDCYWLLWCRNQVMRCYWSTNVVANCYKPTNVLPDCYWLLWCRNQVMRCYWSTSVVANCYWPAIVLLTAIGCFGAETKWWDAIGPQM